MSPADRRVRVLSQQCAAAGGSTPAAPSRGNSKSMQRMEDAQARLRQWEDHFPRRLRGKSIVIAGSATGIGAAAARRCAREGACVALLDKRVKAAEELARDIAGDSLVREAGGAAVAIECDVSEEESVERAVKQAVAWLAQANPGAPGLDGLFSNAGTSSWGWVHETHLKDWEAVLKVNLTASFLMSKHCLPHMMNNGRGASIVTTGSIASFVAGPGGSAASYAASKGGLMQLTRQIAVDYGSYGIRANALCPGPVATDMGSNIKEDRDSGMFSGQTPIVKLPRPRPWSPLKRPSHPAEQAAVVAFLLSDDASFVTGQPVVCDGGLLAT